MTNISDLPEKERSLRTATMKLPRPMSKSKQEKNERTVFQNSL